MTDLRILIAGFGGQGIQFAGKLLTYVGMYTGHEVSLIPSYGPEMRGGTSNCSVNISSNPIASPLVVEPTHLIAMNLPSFDRFEPATLKGGTIYIDSTLISRKGVRSDLNYVYLPATGIADENGMKAFANVIMCGKFLKDTGLCGLDQAQPIIKKLVPAKRPELFEFNMKALGLGYSL